MIQIKNLLRSTHSSQVVIHSQKPESKGCVQLNVLNLYLSSIKAHLLYNPGEIIMLILFTLF